MEDFSGVGRARPFKKPAPSAKSSRCRSGCRAIEKKYNEPADTMKCSPEFTNIAAGGRTACGGTSTGELLCWGNGVDGELGNGQFGTSAATPTAVTGGLQMGGVVIGANEAGQATVCAFG